MNEAGNLMGREGFDAAHEKSLIATMRLEARKYSKEKPETVKWVEDFLSRVDFDEIYKICTEHARRSGVPESQMNFIGDERIFTLPGGNFIYDNYSMAQFSEANAIVVNGTMLSKNIEQERMNAKVLFATYLHYLIHEYVHVVGLLNKNIDMHRETVRSGYRIERSHAPKDRTDEFHLFNEGITNVIARRMMREYLSRKPFQLPDGDVLTTSDLKDFEKNYRLPEELEQAEVFVVALAERIARACEVPYQTVMDAFVQGYYKESGVFSTEGRTLLHEIVGEGFTENLPKAKTKKDFDVLMENMAFSDAKGLYDTGVVPKKN